MIPQQWNFIMKLLTLFYLLGICCSIGEKACYKCKEYSKYVYVNEPSPVMSVSSQMDLVSKCGIVETPLIVGGQGVNEIEFPHMAAIGYKSNDPREPYAFKCGGSIISEQYILTAAHCATDRENGPPVVAKLGVIDYRDNGPSSQLVNVAYFMSHPQYKSDKYFDIALIRLASPIRFNEYVRPACVCFPNAPPRNYTKVIAIGYGKTHYENDKGSPHLLKVLLNYVDRATCIRTYQSYPALKHGIIDSQFCAGDASGSKDSCQGDSGGPLQIVMTEPYCMYNIIGVTSFGKFCGFANSYGVYTNVASFMDFIEKIVWP